MPVKLWTGAMGSGKTSQMISDILKFKKEHPERPVFAMNIQDLDPSVAEPLTIEQLHQWWDLPPDSLIAIDECNEDEYFPLDHGKPAAWVKRMVKVRREGMDFWMTTVHPTLMSSYVRKLVDQHVHCVRKFNSNVVMRHLWNRTRDNCENESVQKVAVTSIGTLDKSVFELYQSSTSHNMKRRIPLRAMVLPLAVVVAICALLAVPKVLRRLHDQTTHPVAAAAVGAPGAPGQVPEAGSESERMRREDFAKWMRPRVDGLPWSAPMFDGLAVRAQPRLFCIAVEDMRCSCVTEQGTKYAVPLDRCRSIAAGGLYNPFVDSQQEQRQGQGATARAAQQPTAPPVPVAVGQGTTNVDSGIRASYVPPEFTPPNA